MSTGGIHQAGLASTSYQQSDDTGARVGGRNWHTHILCNPFYTFYATRSGKFRQDVLAPHKSIAQASAIVYYRSQQLVPVVQVLVCDDAAQFKLTTERIQLCWIHEGRHYEKLAPAVPQHERALKSFQDSFWEYYARLQSYREEPTSEEAERLREDFKQLFSTKTGYDDLDKRIASTGAKPELLTVLDHSECPLHNNASELGARVSARRRDVSLHSRGAKGAHAMDVFTTIVQTCKKLSQSSYEFFRQFLTCEKSALDIPQMIRLTACQQIPALC